MSPSSFPPSQKRASSSSSSRSRDEKPPPPPPHGIPFLFLSSIAAASLLAHKYWPRGFVHGRKEDWELSELALRARRRRQAEREEAARRREGREGRRTPTSCRAAHDDRGPLRAERRGDGRGCYYYYYYYHHHPSRGGEEGEEVEEVEDASACRSSSRGWDWGDATGGTATTSSTPRTMAGRRWSASHRELPTARSYLPERDAAAGYPVERSATSAGSRFSGSGSGRFSRRGNFGGDRSSEVVHVYHDAPARSRRVSFDAGYDRYHYR